MKKNIMILGSSCFLQSQEFNQLPPSCRLVSSIADRALVSMMSQPIVYDRQSLLSGKDKALTSQLMCEYEKGILNEIAAINPDILVFDFFPDIQFGISETALGSFITNNPLYYGTHSSFREIRTYVDYHPYDDKEMYHKLWLESLKKLMNFINKYLPKTQIVLYENRKVVDDYAISNGLLTNDDTAYTLLKELNNIAKKNYHLSIVSDLSTLDLTLGHADDNTIYDYNLIRNPSFENDKEFWLTSGHTNVDEGLTSVESGELVYHGHQKDLTIFNISSNPIHVGGSPERPVQLLIYFEVFVSDVFSLETNSDHIFVARGFDDVTDVSHGEAKQKLYDFQAKLLNLTSGKWKAIKKVITVTTSYLRVGPYVRRKGNATVKWRNLSIKHYHNNEY